MTNIGQKILWLSDFNLQNSPGGAQRSHDILIKKGQELGFDIILVTHEMFGRHVNLNEYDVVISSNLAVIGAKNPWVYDALMSHKYHVRCENDSCQYTTHEQIIKLFSFCKKTVFLTQFHYDFFVQAHGNIFQNVEIIPDPIDTELFKNVGGQREQKILYSGYMHFLKGTSDFFEIVLNNPQNKFVIAGFTESRMYDFLAVNIPNVEYLGLVTYDKMPEIYNKYSHFYYNPNLKEPFCRSVCEAALSGMQLIISEQKAADIGCLQDIKKYGLDKFRENCKNAAADFWEKI